MPTDCTDNLAEFTQCVSTLHAIVEENDVEGVYMLGDFNAHPHEPFCNELISLCVDYDWVCADLEMLGIGSGTYTYVSEANGSKRWLEHCVLSRAAMETAVHVAVNYGVYWSDHQPLCISCNLDLIKQKSHKNIVSQNKTTWGVRTQQQIDEYTFECNKLLRNIDFPPEFNNCCDNHCNEIEHRIIIDKLYLDIVNSISYASKLTSGNQKANKKKQVMGWNKYVADAHREARLKFCKYLAGMWSTKEGIGV